LPLQKVLISKFAELALDEDLPAIVGHQVGSPNEVLPICRFDDPGHEFLEPVTRLIRTPRNPYDAHQDACPTRGLVHASENPRRLLTVDDLRVLYSQDFTASFLDLLGAIANDRHPLLKYQK